MKEEGEYLASKKSKTPSKKQQDLNQKKAEALKKIVEHNRDYLKLDITLPLGDTALKKVHTNQWCFTTLPEEFSLGNWAVIAKALNANTNRYEGYVENRWYIDSVTIDVDASGKAEMKLGCNAFASSLQKYADDFRSFEKAYTDATTKKTTSASKNTSNATSSQSSLKGGEGKVIDDLVANICKNITDDLEKCKAVHQWLKENVRYAYYECTKYSTVESCYNHRGELNCADTARLTRAMMSSAGLNAWVVHRSSNNGHFWTLIKINGKIYASDQTGSGSDFNTIWYSDGDRRTCNDRGGNWDVENGKNPDC